MALGDEYREIISNFELWIADLKKPRAKSEELGDRRQESVRMEVGGSLRLDFAHLRLRFEAKHLLV